MIVAVITAEKAEELEGTEYTPGVKFNPIEITHNDETVCIISLVEAQYLSVADIVELIDYVPEEIEEEEE